MPACHRRRYRYNQTPNFKRITGTASGNGGLPVIVLRLGGVSSGLRNLKYLYSDPVPLAVASWHWHSAGRL